MRKLVGMSGPSVKIAEAIMAKCNIQHCDIVDMALAINDMLEVQWMWPRPIPVSERLPEPGVSVLACVPSLEGIHWIIAVVHEVATHGCWVNADTNVPLLAAAVTHWLPLPPNPTTTAPDSTQ